MLDPAGELTTLPDTRDSLVGWDGIPLPILYSSTPSAFLSAVTEVSPTFEPWLRLCLADDHYECVVTHSK